MGLADAGFFGVAVQILRLDVYDPAEASVTASGDDAGTADSRYATSSSAASAIPSVAAGTATAAAASMSLQASLSRDSSATGKLTNAITQAAREEGIIRL